MSNEELLRVVRELLALCDNCLTKEQKQDGSVRRALNDARNAVKEA